MTGSGGGQQTDDSTDGREVMVRELRRVLDQQIADQQDIDDKAARTVRLILLAAGVLATAFSLGPNPPSPTVPTAVTLVCFALGIGSGVVAYTHTSLWTGTTPSNFDADADENPSAGAVRLELIEEYPGRIEANANGIATDAFLLRVTQFFLTAGVLVTVADFLAG